MEAAQNVSQGQERAHAWVDRKKPSGHTWQERDCPVCGLHDMRLQQPSDAGHFRARWGVTTPCIEPVPKRLSFEDFIADLKKHGIDALAARRELIPHAKGHPGSWKVGFLWYGERDELRLDPSIGLKKGETLDHGWAHLLRWLRARQYAPRTHRYDSTNIHGITLVHSRDSCCDDDD